MIKKRTFASLIMVILITQFIVVQTTQGNSIFNNLVVKSTRNDNDLSMRIITPDAPPGVEVVKSNVKENGGFEEAGSIGARK